MALIILAILLFYQSKATVNFQKEFKRNHLEIRVNRGGNEGCHGYTYPKGVHNQQDDQRQDKNKDQFDHNTQGKKEPGRPEDLSGMEQFEIKTQFLVKTAFGNDRRFGGK